MKILLLLSLIMSFSAFSKDITNLELLNKGTLLTSNEVVLHQNKYLEEINGNFREITRYITRQYIYEEQLSINGVKFNKVLCTQYKTLLTTEINITLGIGSVFNADCSERKKLFLEHILLQNYGNTEYLHNFHSNN